MGEVTERRTCRQHCPLPPAVGASPKCVARQQRRFVDSQRDSYGRNLTRESSKSLKIWARRVSDFMDFMLPNLFSASDETRSAGSYHVLVAGNRSGCQPKPHILDGRSLVTGQRGSRTSRSAYQITERFETRPSGAFPLPRRRIFTASASCPDRAKSIVR